MELVDNNHNNIMSSKELNVKKNAMKLVKEVETLKVSKDLDFDVDLSHIHDQTVKLKNELIKEITEKTEKFKMDVETLFSRSKRDTSFDSPENSPENSPAKNKTRKENGLREKVFEHRESLLTELFKISHIRTFRHIFISLLIIICAQILVFDYTQQGKLNLDFDLFRWCFAGFGLTMVCTWMPMQLCGLYLVYYTFKLWAVMRKKNKSTFLNVFFMSIYLTYIFSLIVLPLIVVNKVSVACRIIILMEQVRILMKSHAFVRSNIPRVLTHSSENSEKNDSNQPKPDGCPKFSKYLYFMFAPTLVYRDNYPRTKATNWGLVAQYFAEILGSIIYTYCLFDRFCVPVFRNLKVKELNLNGYLHLISICVLPGALMQLMIFFSFLHCWHNAFAEMMRFGDRQFYLDWWNSTSYNNYYRTWNTLVQDWLYSYIYHDLYAIFGKKYRALCQFSVIFISSIFHEHILSFTFGFFYPVMFVLFSGFGFICMFIPRGNSAPWNVFIWTSLFTGIGIQICLFSVEWYARSTNDCPRTIDSFIDYLVPRSILC